MVLMDAAFAYAKRYYKDQQEVIQRAKGLRIQAERRLGEILRDIPKANGGDAQRTRYHIGTESPATLSEIGIDKKTSARAQKLAALLETKFAAVVAGEISVAKATASPVKKAMAKTRAVDAIEKHKVVAVNEGGTYLITCMRTDSMSSNIHTRPALSTGVFSCTTVFIYAHSASASF